jgi:NodT family efflux transporter outer membrane factor (OMF) lipoprotein
MRVRPNLSLDLTPATLAAAMLLALAGCANTTVPAPSTTAEAPADWATWHGGDASLVPPAAELGAAAPATTAARWAALGDPVLSHLTTMAVDASPDLRIAILRVLEARADAATVAAQRGPQVNGRAGVDRQRVSENGSATRLLEIIGSNNPAFNPQELIGLVATPYTVYQAGFDASWELDLWGRVRHSVELAEARGAESRALLSQARLTLSAELARTYFELRATQRQRAEVEAQVAASQASERLLDAQRNGGLSDETPLLRQQAADTDLAARLATLRAQEAAALNRIAKLCGRHPGALDAELDAAHAPPPIALPPLAPGLPSDLARHRPDVAAAEARLAQATAGLGVATADLYPRITIGATFGVEALHGTDVFEWGSRQWNFGPSLQLPIFDMGRRRATIDLRTLQQTEAAVAWHQTVLNAWHEIDDALSAYQADRATLAAAQDKSRHADDALALARARRTGGLTDTLPVLDAERSADEARRQVAEADGHVRTQLVALYKALGNDGTLALADDAMDPQAAHDAQAAAGAADEHPSR